jgi:hypothetical protein
MTVLVGIAIVVVGGFFLWIGTLGTEWYQVASTQLGTAIIITAGLGVLWDWFGRRLLADEIFDKMNVAFNVSRWGLKDLTMSWNDQRWSKLFAASSNVDVMISYGQTWRGVAASGLEEFLASKNNVLRVCLPDPDEQWLLTALSHRFNTTPERVAEKIRDASSYFADLRDKGQATVQVFYRTGEPLYGLYRFESVAVLTLYPHRKERSTKIPTLVVEGGELLEFVKGDFEDAIRDAREVSDHELRSNN